MTHHPLTRHMAVRMMVQRQCQAVQAVHMMTQHLQICQLLPLQQQVAWGEVLMDPHHRQVAK
jgi:hypothetical protein